MLYVVWSVEGGGLHRAYYSKLMHGRQKKNLGKSV